MPVRPETVTRMEVNLDHIRHNYQQVRRHAAGADIYAVVKSEAYAHGAVPVAKALAELGCRHWAVALVDEGIQLRRAAIDGEIMVMGATLPAQFAALAEHDLVPVIPDAARIQAWAASARAAGRRLPYHLKVDVGLGRMGYLPWQAEEAAAAAAGAAQDLELAGVSGHLNSPGGPEDNNALEEARFHQFCAPVRKRFPQAKRHLAASQATGRYPRMHLELVRIGGLLYGLQHVREGGLDLRPAMEFKSAVAQVRELPAGWHIGYDFRYRVEAPMRMALLPLGWTDIFSTPMLSQADVLIGGVPRRLVGLCTDFAMVDVTGGPDVTTGDEVVIIGRQGEAAITAIELARRGSISTGQLLGKISLRVPRVYLSGGRAVGELSLLYPA